MTVSRYFVRRSYRNPEAQQFLIDLNKVSKDKQFDEYFANSEQNSWLHCQRQRRVPMQINIGITCALLAAILFGASTPFAKLLIGQSTPLLLAGLLYLGSGIGLGLWLILRRLSRGPTSQDTALPARDWPWLAGVVIAGGMIGPVLLMTGLGDTPASTASLLLNLEGVLTALLAWFVFHEQFDRRIFFGMTLIVVAGILLAWEQSAPAGQAFAVPWGAVYIAAACLCWAIDNNLTRRISAGDAVQIAAIKGLAAGAVNLSIAWWLGSTLPALNDAAIAGIIGFCGYGLSLVLFVVALRHLGTARTGAYFSMAPFAGAAISVLMLGEIPTPLFWAAAILMAAGIWLHLTEKHVHQHKHERMTHAHVHTHDAHHRHRHDFPWDGKEPHTHHHQHAPLLHKHPHFPDIHHRHRH
jgi:drug/metabolite transporter (DMT)-like permease